MLGSYKQEDSLQRSEKDTGFMGKEPQGTGP